MDDGSRPEVARDPADAPPASVRAASTVMALQGLLLAALVAATVLWEDVLITAWASDNAAASAVVQEGGLTALDASPVAVPDFVPLAVVVFLTLVPIGAVLAAMLRHRAAWVRSWLTAGAAGGVLAAGLATRTGAPLAFTVLAVLAGVTCVALVACLWHPATTRWLARPAQVTAV
jgi:hypothetical protein